MIDHDTDLSALKEMAHGLVLAKQWQEAAHVFSRICAIDPSNDQAWLMSGAINGQLGNIEEAEICCRKVLTLRPDCTEAYINLGNVLQAREQWEEALKIYQIALRLDAGIALSYYNIGVVSLKLGRLEEAKSSFRRALELQPNHAVTWASLGSVLENQCRLEESQECFEAALKLNPNDQHSLMGLGIVFAKQAKFEQSAKFLTSALDSEPQNPKILSFLIYILQYLCSWDQVNELMLQLDQLTTGRGKEALRGISPFEHIVRSVDLEVARMVAEAACEEIANRIKCYEKLFSFDERRKSAHKKIRIAYLSSDFYDHPTAHLMRGMFRLHDHKNFEISVYAYGPDDGSEYRAQIKSYCDHFIDIHDLGLREAAERIYKDRIDILIDLKGHTSGARLEICALHPAPVQVTYLGFPGTSGAGFFDYIIADKIVIPEQHASFYSEKVVYMPESYQANDDLQEVAARHYERADFGLPDDALVFCSFNQTYKVDSIMFHLWMDIMAALPDSVLWLYCRNATTESNLRKTAQNRGIQSERLIFADPLPKAAHLARLKLADIALDTRICNGHTTTSDALSVGVPVVALQGSHFASRVSSSLLRAHRVPELISYTLDEYRGLAIQLGSDRSRLKILTSKLASQNRSTPLFDSERFTRDFECALREIWRIYLSDERPRMIDVTALSPGTA